MSRTKINGEKPQAEDRSCPVCGKKIRPKFDIHFDWEKPPQERCSYTGKVEYGWMDFTCTKECAAAFGLLASKALPAEYRDSLLKACRGAS